MIRSPIKAWTAICLAGLLAACSGKGGASLKSIDISPQTPSAAAGVTTQMTATGVYSDGGRTDVTNQVSWSSSNTAVASVSAGAVVTGIAAGSTTISATLDGTSARTTYTVTPAVLVSIQVTPPSPSIASGTNVLLTATGIFSDNSNQNLTNQVTWSSSNAAVAVTNTNGLATGASAGTAVISAARGSISGSTTLKVTTAVLTSIQVTPAAPSIAKGYPKQFTATGIFSDNSTQNLTNQVTWSSSDSSVATISASGGLALGAGAGTATISAATSGLVGRTTFTVTPAVLTSLQVTPATPTLAKGVVQQFTATGLFSDNSTQDLTTLVTWSSSNTASATVGITAGTAGIVTATGTGTAVITASLGSISNNTSVTVTPAVLVAIQVTPAAPNLPLGLTQQFLATGVYSDNTTQNLTTLVTWASSAMSVATISSAAGTQGVATPVVPGNTTITAILGTQSGSTSLTVTPAALVSIQVTPAIPSIAKGLTQQFTATGIYTDNSTQNLTTAVTWTSGTPAVATISPAAGLATSAGVGPTTITATAPSSSISGSTTLTVTAATLVSIQVTPTSPSIANGLTEQFTATGTYTDTSTQDLTTAVTWTSGTPGVATISPAAGLATSASVGPTTITATAPSSSISGSTILTVTAATLVSIQVTPASPSIANGLTQQFTATGTYTDTSTQDLTTAVTWTSGTPGVATISPAAGLATSASVGPTTITASLGTVSGSTMLTVTAAALTSITVTPAGPSIEVGQTQQFTATGAFTAGPPLDLTDSVTWGPTSSTGDATVSNSSGSQGLATALSVGSPTITATSGSVVGTTILTVTAVPVTLASITVTQPSNAAAPNIAIGLPAQFVATGTNNDGTPATPDELSGIVWSSSDTTTATINGTGLATPLKPGSNITIQATVGSVSGSISTSVVTSFQFGTSVYAVLTNHCQSCHSAGTSPASWTYFTTDASDTWSSVVNDTYGVSSLYSSACSATPSVPVMPPGSSAGTGLAMGDCTTISNWIAQGANLD